MEELFGSLTTRVHSREGQERKGGLQKKRKKELALQLLLNCGDENEEDGDRVLFLGK